MSKLHAPHETQRMRSECQNVETTDIATMFALSHFSNFAYKMSMLDYPALLLCHLSLRSHAVHAFNYIYILPSSLPKRRQKIIE